MVLPRIGGDEAEFRVIPFWASIDVQAFAGKYVDVARYFPGGRALPARVRLRLNHFEVARASGFRLHGMHVAGQAL
jgi:hypothetical protein